MYPGKYASLTPNRAAYVMAGSGQVITYTDLERGSNQAAHLFRSLGLARGDHLAICLENHPAFSKYAGAHSVLVCISRRFPIDSKPKRWSIL